MTQEFLSPFGCTRKPGRTAEGDPHLRALLDCGTSLVTVFGKSWDFHVTAVMGTRLDENLAMIRDTVGYLRQNGRDVVYDAEHFFDGFKQNRDYALATLRAAQAAGAHCLVLCDTNGGCLPAEVADIVREVRRQLAPGVPLGIHVHNDTECAVASSLAAVAEGVDHVQGTRNGYGERCGNANLVSIIPNLMLKMRLHSIPAAKFPFPKPLGPG